MKKAIISVILFLCLSSFVLSCTIPTGKPSSDSSLTSSSGDEKPSPTQPVNPSPTETVAFDVLETGTVITAAELGIHSISCCYFYWSPDGEYVVFIGFLKDEKSKYTPNAYLLRLEDKKITKIADGIYDTQYYLSNPTWSKDGMLLTFQFCAQQQGGLPLYLYDMEDGKSIKLPISGFGPSISPDKSKIAYFNGNGDLSLFSLVNQSDAIMPGNLKGFDLNWFSDSTRILFIKMTGRNPSGYEGAELEDFCILDTADSSDLQLLGMEMVCKNLTWIIEDELVWVESGWDDGYQYNLLDLDTSELTELGENNGQYYQVNGGEARFLIYDDQKGKYSLLNRSMEIIGTYSVGKMGNAWYVAALSILPDGRLLYFNKKNSTYNSSFYLSYLDERRMEQLKIYQNNYYPFAYKDGSKIAIIPDLGDEMILIDTSKLG